MSDRWQHLADYLRCQLIGVLLKPMPIYRLSKKMKCILYYELFNAIFEFLYKDIKCINFVWIFVSKIYIKNLYILQNFLNVLIVDKIGIGRGNRCRWHLRRTLIWTKISYNKSPVILTNILAFTVKVLKLPIIDS